MKFFAVLLATCTLAAAAPTLPIPEGVTDIKADEVVGDVKGALPGAMKRDPTVPDVVGGVGNTVDNTLEGAESGGHDTVHGVDDTLHGVDEPGRDALGGVNDVVGGVTGSTPPVED